MQVEKLVVSQSDKFIVLDLEKFKEWFDSLESKPLDYWQIFIYELKNRNLPSTWFFRAIRISESRDMLQGNISEEQANELLSMLDMVKDEFNGGICYEPKKLKRCY